MHHKLLFPPGVAIILEVLFHPALVRHSTLYSVQLVECKFENSDGHSFCSVEYAGQIDRYCGTKALCLLILVYNEDDPEVNLVSTLFRTAPL